MQKIRYVYPSVWTQNYGDYIIDYAVRCILSRTIGEPAAECSIRKGIYPSGDFDCLVIPGITHITAGQFAGMEKLSELPYPTFCLSGSLWSSLPPAGYLVRRTVIRLTKLVPPDLRIVQMLTPPVGTRDPSTYSILQSANIPSLYTGCASLFLPKEGIADDGYVLFSLGYSHCRQQTREALAMSHKHHVIGICHERPAYERYRSAGWTLPLVDFHGDLELYLSYFKRASVVVTGRLHGVLPALAYDKKVFYYGTRDTRTTILDDLGIPIHSYAELHRAIEVASPSFNRYLLDFFSHNWHQLVDQIVRMCGMNRATSRPEALGS